MKGLWKRDVWRVLSSAPFAYLGVETAGGPHVTPVLFAATPDRIWLGIGRGTAKARALRKRPAIGLVVPGENSSVVVRGEATLLDTLPPSATELARVPYALPEFATRNALELAAFAFDVVRARAQPPALAPVSIRVDKLDLVNDWRGDAVLGWMAADGPIALPARWNPQTSRARVPGGLLKATGARRTAPACLCVDESDGLGPLAKRGVLLRGTGRATLRGEVASVALEPTRITRWKGFDTHTEAAARRSPTTKLRS